MIDASVMKPDMDGEFSVGFGSKGGSGEARSGTHAFNEDFLGSRNDPAKGADSGGRAAISSKENLVA